MSVKDINSVSDKELENISGGSNAQSFFRYCVVRGDTLAKIAHRYRTTVDEIKIFNPMIKDENPCVGYMLLIPYKF